MVTATLATDARALVATVPDPELPVVTIEDLGVLRDVRVEDDGHVVVEITPTYSGCPAMEAITAHVSHVIRAAGWEARVTSRLSPAWTTDWMSEEGKEKLRRFGIAPPAHTAAGGPVPVSLGRRTVACPRCGSDDTTELARFGSTACKALRRCEACSETFDEFKTL
jgi:ring-1,2-phenylacetyl-CoA epoxidase subunit PaaD